MNALRRSQIALLAAVGALGVGAPASRAASAAVPGCTGGQVSAIDQYCETIPSVGGAGAPRAGTPSVAITLAPAVVRRLDASRQRALLTLPASAPALAHHGHPGYRNAAAGARSLAAAAPAATSVKVAAASVWSLSAPLIAVLVAGALIITGLAVARRRRSSA